MASWFRGGRCQPGCLTNRGSLQTWGGFGIILRPAHLRTEGYDTVGLLDGDYLAEPGKPLLPAQTVALALPAGMIVTGIRLVASESIELAGEYQLLPAPPRIRGDRVPLEGRRRLSGRGDQLLRRSQLHVYAGVDRHVERDRYETGSPAL